MSSYVTAEATFDGALPRLVNPHAYKEALAAKGWEVGKVLSVRVGPMTRSEKANAYYWGVVLEFIVRHSESGYDADELHDVFCERFIVSERKKVDFYSRLTGESVTTEIDARRSSALTGGPFYDYVEKVREFARVFWGINTPDPDPEYWRKR